MSQDRAIALKLMRDKELGKRIVPIIPDEVPGDINALVSLARIDFEK